MAFLARIEAAEVQTLAFMAAPARIVQKPAFSALEWSIIRLAQIDRLWTIRPLGLLRRAWNWLSGRGNPALANDVSRRFAASRSSAGISATPSGATISPTSSPPASPPTSTSCW